MDSLLHFLGRLFNDNYGLAIIVIVLIVIYITTFNGNSSENMHMMREKTNVVKPELDAIRENQKG